ncbi:MAG: lipoyl synthase [Candidatus Limnocylindrales bacterium]
MDPASPVGRRGPRHERRAQPVSSAERLRGVLSTLRRCPASCPCSRRRRQRPPTTNDPICRSPWAAGSSVCPQRTGPRPSAATRTGSAPGCRRGDDYHELKGLLRGLDLNTVCEEARCPNIGECWDQRTATIMILGDTCTRACGFCAVKTGRPTWFDDDEPRRVALAIGALGLEHVVVTSVARDDLPDGGSRIFAETILAMRATSPGMGIEVLIPDFDGADDRLRTVMDARPDILNHNLETVKRLQKPVRKRARWDRSLYVLRRATEMAREIGYPVHTKSSLMVGLGETRDELQEAFEALRDNEVDILTIGQYLRPSLQHLPLERYYHPDEFAEMKVAALELGFKHVESAPLVRSSYHARDQVPGAELKRLRRQASLDAEGRIVPLAG